MTGVVRTSSCPQTQSVPPAATPPSLPLPLGGQCGQEGHQRRSAQARQLRPVSDTLLTLPPHNQVGSVTKRGISGGQRKRVNIGMELVSRPSVCFMDEPTSGLDSSATLEVRAALKKWVWGSVGGVGKCGEVWSRGWVRII